MEDLTEKEKFELQVRENCIRIVQPYGFLVETDVNEVISRANKIAKYILKGEVPPEKMETSPNGGK